MLLGGWSESCEGGKEDVNLGVEVMACPGGCINGAGQLKRREPAKVDLGEKDSEGYQRSWNEAGVDPGTGMGARWEGNKWVKKVGNVYRAGRGSDVPTPTAVDVLAVSILHEIRRPDSVLGLLWFESTDEKAEAQRRALFRTEYRAVESGVDGLLVW